MRILKTISILTLLLVCSQANAQSWAAQQQIIQEKSNLEAHQREEMEIQQQENTRKLEDLRQENARQQSETRNAIEELKRDAQQQQFSTDADRMIEQWQHDKEMKKLQEVYP